MKNDALSRIHILINDYDAAIAQVVIQNMRAMGFRKVFHVRHAEEATRHLLENPVDLLITEWGRGSETSGVELVQSVRQAPSGAINRMMPIMMVTGHGEATDVTRARDAGINEFIVKPFVTRTLFNRLEQIIDQPRGFVMAKRFLGPDRRRVETWDVGEDKRTIQPRLCQDDKKAIDDVPGLIPSNYVIRRNLAISVPLSSVITKQMLVAAERSIAAMADESMQWVKDDMSRLEKALQRIRPDEVPFVLLAEMKDAALSIKSRAGTFGMPLASEISRLLFLFLTQEYRAYKIEHYQAIKYHIDAIKVAINQRLSGKDALTDELLLELRRMNNRLM